MSEAAIRKTTFAPIALAILPIIPLLAWIPTLVKRVNTTEISVELDTQTFIAEPRDRDICKTEIGSNQQRIVGSPM